jgi:exportin-7
MARKKPFALFLLTVISIDPLESEETLQVSLDMFANVVRTKYTESGRMIVSKFQELSLKYRELIQRASALSGTTTPPIGANDIKESLMVVELQLTWMVYIMAAGIGARVVSLLILGAIYNVNDT